MTAGENLIAAKALSTLAGATDKIIGFMEYIGVKRRRHRSKKDILYFLGRQGRHLYDNQERIVRKVKRGEVITFHDVMNNISDMIYLREDMIMRFELAFTSKPKGREAEDAAFWLLNQTQGLESLIRI